MLQVFALVFIIYAAEIRDLAQFVALLLVALLLNVEHLGQLWCQQVVFFNWFTID